MKIIIYGAGESGKHALNKLKKLYGNEKLEVIGFADSNKVGEYCDLPILDSLNEYIYKIEVSILIAISSRKIAIEKYEYLLKLGFSNIYFYLRKDNLPIVEGKFLENECKKIEWKPKQIIPHIEIHASDHCNLNCKGCAHFSPVFDKKLPNTKERIRDIEMLCKISSNIMSLFIMGGEPLLNPDLGVYIDISRKLLPNTDIELVTNGLLLLNCNYEFMKLLHTNKIIVVISEYEPTSKLRDQILRRLEKYEIEYIIRIYDKKQKFIKPLTLSDKSIHSNTCICDGCVNIYKGKIARCPIVMYIEKINEKFGVFFPEEGKYDMKEIKSVDELNLLMKERIPLCKYCIDVEIDWCRCNNMPQIEDFVSLD